MVNTCENCVHFDQYDSFDMDYDSSPCARCPLARESYHVEPEVIDDQSYMENRIRILLFVERILSTLKSKTTLKIARLLMSCPNMTNSAVAKRLGITRSTAIHHIHKLQRNLPEIFRKRSNGRRGYL